MYKYKYIHIYHCPSFLKVLKIFLKDIFIGISLLVVEYNVGLFIMEDLLSFTCISLKIIKMLEEPFNHIGNFDSFIFAKN